MAMMKCPECKKNMSDTAKTCPQCGCIISKKVRGNFIAKKLTIQNLWFSFLCLIFVATGFFMTGLGFYKIIASSEITFETIFVVLLCLPFSIFLLTILMNLLKKIIHSELNTIFLRLQKYGTPDEICLKIEDEKKKTVYENSGLVITDNMIMAKWDYSKIILIEDMLNIYKTIKKVNGT